MSCGLRVMVCEIKVRVEGDELQLAVNKLQGKCEEPND
jgi:hypothetical protein